MTESVVVLVAGIPGAGKTTLIDRVCSPEWTVLDTDRFRRREPAALRRVPVPYVLYVLAIVAAIARHTQVVVSPAARKGGFGAWSRRARASAAVRRCSSSSTPAADAVPGKSAAGVSCRSASCAGTPAAGAGCWMPPAAARSLQRGGAA